MHKQKKIGRKNTFFEKDEPLNRGNEFAFTHCIKRYPYGKSSILLLLITPESVMDHYSGTK